MTGDEETTTDRLDPSGDEHGTTCPDCQGARLNPISCAVRLPLRERRTSLRERRTSNIEHPTSNKKDPFDVQRSMFNVQCSPDVPSSVSLPELLSLTPGQLLEALKSVKTTKRMKPVLDELLPEIEERMRFMDRVGLGYLQLNRATATLSGGEAQRIRLAAHLGSNLSGVLYVLDEPTTGLHFADVEKLLQVLHRLVDAGNTVLVIEHNLDVMKAADWIIDIGPEGGFSGGQIVGTGTPEDIAAIEESYTGRFLREILPNI
jgi:excinuclease ABC subunit A